MNPYDKYKYNLGRGWKFPYKGLSDPKYVKARREFFRKNGNGWWWTLRE